MYEWQSIITMIGDRYNLAYLALGSGTITSGTVSEFQRVLAMRSGVRVDRVQLLGRVISANITVSQSAPITRLLGGFIVAGTPAITFELMNVTKLTPTTSTAQTVATGTATQTSPITPEQVTGLCWFLGGDNGRFFGIPIPGCPNTNEPELKGAGAAIGSELAGILNPLILPGIIVVAGIYYFGKARGA